MKYTSDRTRFFIPHSAFRIPHSRHAFTLVELLVAMAIIVALAAIVLAFYPKTEKRLATQGADQLQTYIASAKSRALRDQYPRGVRLTPSQLGGFREAQFIEVPEPYAPPQGTILYVPTASTIVYIRGFDVTGAVQYGDMLEISQGNSIHRVLALAYDPNSNTSAVTLASAPPAAQATPYTTDRGYRFIRQPRPLLGEPALQLPRDVLIDPDVTAGGQSLNLPRSYDTQFVDIIFSPSGEVINATGGRIVLWVRDENNVSTPTLLTIYCHTGGCAAHPPCAEAGKSVYAYTQDGRSSGQ